MSALGRVPHLIVDDVAAPELTDDDRHHLTRSLRRRDGDELTVTDGVGSWRVCRLATVLEPVSEVFHVPPPVPRLTVAFARTKGDRPELAVQKLTELGIDHIVVFESDRSVARWSEDRLPRQVERLGRVAREAAMQSRRLHLPVVEVFDGFEEVAALEGAALADLDGETPSLDHPTLLIGPEGGWSDAERDRSPRVRLSARVLRAETAAIAAGVVMAALREGLLDRADRGA
ncbi:MAG TPA: RsmE family RNA methyltransferase [Acidimicrobiales bacterium]|nr:RsmE family RNA methyltransferase [Acidimicrobiales bacterium]